jgi:hypothetical protein
MLWTGPGLIRLAGQGVSVAAKWAWVLAAAALPGVATQAAQSVVATKPGAATHRVTRHPLGGMPDGARDYYARFLGVDELSAVLTDSGALVRFTYRVVDAPKAQALQDRSASPNMLDHASHAVLFIPVMDKVGPLRQAMPAQNGKTYWMAFSNKGGPVKPGHQVSVVIGSVRIDGLIVQ